MPNVRDPRSARRRLLATAGLVFASLVLGACQVPVAPPPREPLASDALVDTSAPPVSGQVVGGSNASLSEFPWMVGLLASNESDPFLAQFCGGAAVTSTKVVTAAHCVVDFTDRTALPSEIQVLTGTSALFPGSGTRHTVTEISVHPSFTINRFRDDLAVLTVPTMGASVTPIEVMSPEAGNHVASGRVAKVAGWGCVLPSADLGGDCEQFPELLQRADLTIRSNALCNLVAFEFFAAGTLCAGPLPSGSPIPNACNGDSGGPLSVAGSPGPLLAGVVSYGRSGCIGSPSVHTRLSSYRSWLVANGVPVRSGPFSPRTSTQVRGTYRPVTGDFNGDGRTDVFWYSSNSADSLWLGSSTGLRPGPAVRQVTGSYGSLVGDFDGDGDDDIFWYAPGATPERLWRGSPAGTFSTEAGRTVGGTFRPVVGDFDGDGDTDIFWYAPGTTAEVLWQADPSRPTLFVSAPAQQVAGTFQPASGDFDGNGSDDIYWYAPGSSADVLWRGSPTGPTPGPAVMQINGTYQLLVGDYDGDGRDDLFGYGAGTALDLIWRGAAGGFDRQTDALVNGTYRTATGDLNGDGRDDVLWHGPGAVTDSWYAGVTVP
jgi:secreted trypsin-like serine protease